MNLLSLFRFYACVLLCNKVKFNVANKYMYDIRKNQPFLDKKIPQLKQLRNHENGYVIAVMLVGLAGFFLIFFR